MDPDSNQPVQHILDTLQRPAAVRTRACEFVEVVTMQVCDFRVEIVL